MKRIYSFLILMACSIIALAQSPQRMTYQCVVRNAGGVLVVNKSVGIRISIMQGTPQGTVVFQETYNPTPETNANGLVTIEIGSGLNSIGSFSSINWESGPFFLMTENDPDGGSNYTIAGSSQLLSVPYAIYANKAGNVFSGNYSDLSNRPALFSGDYADLSNKPVIFSGDYSDLLNRPALFGGNYNDLTNKPLLFDGNWSNITGKPTTLSGYGITNAMSISHPSFSITEGNITNWNNAFQWVNQVGSGFEPSITGGTVSQYWRGDKTWQTLNKSVVGLSNVENISLNQWAGSGQLTTLGTITSGTWNAGAVTSSGSVTAERIVKAGGTSSQFLKADGSIDENNYNTALREETNEINASSGQTSFTLTRTPNATSRVKMYINGVRVSNTAYSVTNNILTYVPANNGSYVLTAGDRIQIDYSY